MTDDNDDVEIQEAILERAMDPDFALISDYAAGELSLETREQVRARLESDPDFRELAEPLLLAWSVPRRRPSMSDEELKRAWLTLRARAGMPMVPGQTVTRRRVTLSRYPLAAAVLVAALLVPAANSWWADRAPPLRSDVGGRAGMEVVRTSQAVSVMLPDGSGAALTDATTLRYRSGFVGGREVRLAGQGRFDVRPGTSPFTVVTNDAEVWVTGTSFTVHAYKGTATLVTVHQGTVRVRALHDGVVAWQRPLVLLAGQSARVFRNSRPELLP